MRRSTTALATTALAAVAVLFAAAPAYAEPQRSPAVAKRTLQLCEDSRIARRAFERDHGPMVWITAPELAAAVRAGETWSAPRCIRPVELRRWEASRLRRPMTVANAR